MLVLLSDLHLNDGSGCEPLEPEAFRRGVEMILQMARDADARELRLVYLGDTFDLARTTYWQQTRIRPWSSEHEHDPMSHNLRQTVDEITSRICGHQANRRASDEIRRLREELARSGVAVHASIVLGNTDWLVNRYPEARTRMASFLDVPNARRFETERFSTELFLEPYRTIARHGDIYDPMSYDGDRDRSSLSDAAVIDLLMKLPVRVAQKLGSDADPVLMRRLRELSFVRPAVDAPLLVRAACMGAGVERAGHIVREAWNELVDEFLEIPFVRHHEVPWRLNMVDALQFGLKLSRHLSFMDIENMPLRKLQTDLKEFHRRAIDEPRIRDGSADFVVYGHTHLAEIIPLQAMPGTCECCRTYFNAGTWRRGYLRTTPEAGACAMLSCHSLNVLAVYLPQERQGRRFEVSSSTLAERPLTEIRRKADGEYASESATRMRAAVQDLPIQPH